MPVARTPEELEREITATRESLHRDFDELQGRLSPKSRLRRMRDGARSVPQASYYSWLAFGAIVTGVYLAITGWRRTAAGHTPDEMVMGEVTMVDVAVPCSPTPPL